VVPSGLDRVDYRVVIAIDRVAVDLTTSISILNYCLICYIMGCWEQGEHTYWIKRPVPRLATLRRSQADQSWHIRQGQQKHRRLVSHDNGPASLATQPKQRNFLYHLRTPAHQQAPSRSLKMTTRSNKTSLKGKVCLMSPYSQLLFAF
jgi:hypothetical protein